MRAELVDLEVIFQTTTAKGGLCVRLVEDGEDVWLPLGTVEIEPKDAAAG